MNAQCEDLELYWTERAMGRLEPDVAERVDAHLAACPTCRAGYEETAGIVKVFRSEPVPEPRPLDWERLDAAVREQDDALARRRKFRLIRRTGLATAAAAAVLLGASVTWFGPGPEYARGTLQVFAPAGGTQPASEPQTVMLTLGKGKTPAPGAKFSVLRGGRKVGHGVVKLVLPDGRIEGGAWAERGERIESGDEVRFGR